jgi:hypothetical protein
LGGFFAIQEGLTVASPNSHENIALITLPWRLNGHDIISKRTATLLAFAGMCYWE